MTAQQEERTARLMRTLYGLWRGRSVQDRRAYQTGDKYSPHMLETEGESLPRQTLRGLVTRDWVWVTKEPRQDGQRPHGSLWLTDEGQDIVLAMRVAEGD
jgi:hypothetical protein